jgi:phosphatidylglycerol:prolipoprotein diacylglycerol transferase
MIRVWEIDGFWPTLDLPLGMSIPTYYLIISVTALICLTWTYIRSEKERVDQKFALDLILLGMILGFIGARAFHVVFEDRDFYSQHPEQIIKFWNGGFVYFGGAILAFLGTAAFVKIRGESISKWGDFFAPVGALSYALGRTACWVTGCCFGAVCITPWARFRHPTQLYAVIWESAVLILLLRLEKKPRPPGLVFCAWIFLHACGRIGMEALRVDPRGPEPLGVSISTWISLGLLLISLVYWLKLKRPPAPFVSCAGKGK